MKKFLLIPLGVALIACSNYRFNADQRQISATLKNIAKADQTVRKYKIAINAKYGIRTRETVWDSMRATGAELGSIDVLKIPPRDYQVQRLPPEIQKAYRNEINAGEHLMAYLDSLHLYQVYALTRRYGYPSNDARKWQNDSLKAGIGFVLTHFDYTKPQSLKLLKLLIKEHKAKRLTDEEMRYLIWHVNGRTKFSDMSDIDIEQWSKQYK